MDLVVDKDILRVQYIEVVAVVVLALLEMMEMELLLVKVVMEDNIHNLLDR
jgi:hypothetical protein